MKIVNLKSENVQRIKAVDITPEGNMVVIGGKNGQGKTSVLDSITMALGGKSVHSDQPIRRGQRKAKVICDLGDIVVTRVFNASGGKVVIKGKDGADVPGPPQTMLDKLYGKLSFNPLAFSTMDADKRMVELKKLVGLDFTDVDKSRAAAYAARTNVNRQIKTVEAKLSGMAYHNDAPSEEIKTADILAELEKAKEQNRKNDGIVICLEQCQIRENEIVDEVISIKSQIAGMYEKLKHAEASLKETQVECKNWTEKASAIVEIDEDVFYKQLQEAEGENARVRDNIARKKEERELKPLLIQVQELTDQITDIDGLKEKKLAETEFPIPGLSFDEDGVLYNGVPFDQASSAEKLRVSVAMGIAMNPELNVLLIRDGSLLDDENLDLIHKMAAEADAQVWVERVGKGDECQVIIEDGEVVEGDSQ